LRPILLKMTAFGAYAGEVELNFEKGLRGENFFLIHGATGSGKTTILDAICFALYGESSGGGRKGSMLRSEQAKPDYETKVDFTFAMGGKIYRIVRNPKYTRAKIRGEGFTEKKAAAEIYVNGEFITVKDVSDYVRELLMFDCEQFRQVVMLPQGDFKKFLLAKSKDKQDILNMLFNADFFRRVEEELKIKASDAKKIFDTLTDSKKNYLEEVGAPEEELPALIKKLTDELDATQLQIKKLEAESNLAQKNFSDAENLSKLFKDFESKSKMLDEANFSLKNIAKAFDAAKTELGKRTTEETLRENLKLQAAELDKKKIALQNLQAKQKEFDKAVETSKNFVAEVEKLDSLKKRCDDTMAKIKSDAEKISDAPAKFEIAKQKLKEAQERENLLREIAELHGKISLAMKNSDAAKKSCEAAEKFLANLRECQNSGSAARLAATLEEGKPCPVCGAIHHPTPAKSDSTIPTDAQIKAAESKLKSLTDKKSDAEKILSTLQGELQNKEKNLADGAKVMTVAAAQAEFDKISADAKELETLNARIKKGELKIKETEKALTAAQEKDKKFSGEVATLRGALDNMLKEIEEKYSANPKLLDAEISSINKQLNELNAAFQKAQENFNRLNGNLAAQKATVAAAQKNKTEIAAQVEGKTLPDVFALKKTLETARTAYNSAIESKTKISTQIERLKNFSEKISSINAKLITADKNFLMWKTLSDAASGKTSKISFQRYYLSTMFNEVIIEANNRLEKMSGGRYRFQNKTEVTDKRYSGGLDLEILDDYTGTARPVETLSGGESFLASLSLALGLAAVVQNNSGGIKLDTIFIDEGFGTLDSETLDFAIKTLIDLQSGGRLVGIISHVEELKNQIPIRLEVRKTKTGSTAEFKSAS